MRSMIASLILLPLLLFSQPSAPLFVAPYGAGIGTPDDPMRLSAALSSAGEYWLLPGVYKGDLSITTNGITLRSVPGTRARIDGSVDVWASDTTIDGVEITYTGWISRTSAYAGSNPPDVVQKGLSIYGPRTRILNSRIHDLTGIGFWKTATDSEMRGNLIYNSGWQGPDRGHGPGIYSQNNPDGSKLIADNVMGPSYSMTGFEFYGSSIAPLQHFHIERNVMIGTRFLLGGGQPVVDAKVKGNLLWKSGLEVGYTNPLNGDAEIRDNYIAYGRILPHTLQSLVMTGNTAVNVGGLDVMELFKPSVPYTYTIDQNIYHSNRTQVFWNGAGNIQTFGEWQASGYDASGSFGGLPNTNRIFMQPTLPHHGIVTIYNWHNDTSIALDLSSLNLTSGAIYRLVNAQNPAEYQAFTAGSPVSVAMTGWTVAIPYAATAPIKPSTFPQFGVFLVEPGA